MSIIHYRGPRRGSSLLNDFINEIDALYKSPSTTSVGAASDSASEVPRFSWSPTVDVKEEESRYVVHADVPGMQKGDIELSIDDSQRTLVIRGEKRHDAQETDKGFLRIERHYGSFYRAFSLPERVDASAVNAKVEHGVLEIVLPKAAQETTRKITIN